ncbi:MAG: glycosyltransferase family 4 protein [Verrucomicrobiales bacterium]
MKKECILIIVENLPVPLDRRVWQESCALRDAGYEVVVICPKMRGYTKSEELLDGIQIYRHWISSEAGGFAGFFMEYASALLGEFRLIWKAWFKHRFKLIHLCNPPDILFTVALPFRLFGVKVIYDVHDLWPEMFEAKFGKKGLFYRAVRFAERLTHAISHVVIATNESVREVALTRGGKRAEDVFIVRTAPKIAGLDRPPDPALKKGRKFLAGYIGVMGDADGVDLLVETVDIFVNKLGRRDVQFLFMGTGPEHGKLVALRDQKGLQEYLDLPGRVTNDFLFTALQTIDVGLSGDPKNSYNDGCTMNKVLEYMAFGKPQIMFDLVEGRASAKDASWYVTGNSPARMAEALAKLLDDPAARAQMGELGAKRLHEELHWGKSVEQLEKAYQRALHPG